jgi:hypothetical protein
MKYCRHGTFLSSLTYKFNINLLKYSKVDNYLYDRHNLAIHYMIKSSKSALLAVYRCFSSCFWGPVPGLTGLFTLVCRKNDYSGLKVLKANRYKIESKSVIQFTVGKPDLLHANAKSHLFIV